MKITIPKTTDVIMNHNHNHDYDNQRERSTMEESSTSDRTSSVLSSSGGMNNKMTSDSGYGSNSNKSHNSQSQRSSGSSESQKSSLSSGSCSFLSHPLTATPNIEQHGQGSSGGQPSSSSFGKPRQEKEHKRKKKSSKGKTMTGSGGESGQRLASSPMDTMTMTMPSGTKTTKSSNVPVTCESGISSSNNNTISNSSASVPSSSVPLFSSKGATSSTGDISQQPSPDGRHANDSKALQMAALTHALSCIRKFRDQDLDLIEESDDDKMSNEFFWNEYFESMREELTISSENGFGAIVSMEDGLVVHITKELSQILGYPKDMWLGRSFMDLVHPKDKMAFASQFTSTNGISFPTQGDTCTPNKGAVKQSKEDFFCRLRQYRGLKTTGYGIADKAVVFFPFSLTLKLREVDGIQKIKRNNGDEVENVEKKAVYLFIGANRLASAYQYPEEVPQSPDKFITRHNATCQFGHIDPAAVSYLGHLPQDVVGNSVLDYYHPDDMILLRDIYEGVMNERGKPFKSKPYRFRVYNGTFAMLETDWSCFINPWSWKLEFVIGQHTVLKGPLNPNVFMAPPPSAPNAPSEEGEGKNQVQDEIKKLLAETVSRRISDPLKQRSSRRKKDLAVLLETLLDQIGNETSDQSDSVASGVLSCLGRDSAMLGEISPHRDDHSLSNQSSETPPSYNQLNYRENIERFFLSQPKTTRESDESVGDTSTTRPGGGNDAPQMSTDEESKGSRNESSDSANRQSSGSFGENNDTSEGQAAGVNDDGEKCALTVDVLYRHNENMEKRMVQRHREIRGKNPSSISLSASNKIARTKDMGGKSNNLKRSGNFAGWTSTESSSRKAHKQPHMEIPSNYTESCQPHPSSSSVNLWPPFSVVCTDPTPTPTFSSSMIQQRRPQEGQISGLPTFMQTQSATTGGGLQNINQMQPPYLYVHNQQQFFQQPVPYAYPSNLSIYQPLGQTIYGQTTVPVQVPAAVPNSNVYGASQTILMSPRVPTNPAAQPTIPILQAPQIYPSFVGPIRGMSVAGRIPIPNLNTRGLAGIGHLIPTSVPGIPIVQSSSNIPVPSVSLSSSPISLSLHSTSTSTSTSTVSTSSSSSSTPISSCFFPTRLSTTVTTAGTFNNKNIMNNNSNVNSRRIPGKEHNILSQQQQSNQTHHHHHHYHHNNNSARPNHNHNRYGNSNYNHHHNNKDRPTELQLWKMAKERLEMTRRGIPLKASADFSSSDGFGESSSGSLYSLLKNDKCSDDSLHSLNSREDKDSLERFPSNNSDGDQDMLWENHVDKEQDLLMKNGIGKRKKLNKKAPWLQDVEMTPEISFRYQIEPADMSDILQKDLARLKIMGPQPQLVDEQLGELKKELAVGGRSRSNSLNLNEGSSKYGSSFGSDYDDDDDENDNEKDPEGNEKEKMKMHKEHGTDCNKEISGSPKNKQSREEENKEENEKVDDKTVQTSEQNQNTKKDKTKKSKRKITASDYDKIVQTYEENAPFPQPVYVRN